ncbi:hypothetical protein B0A50_05361 [Salinomyces thailandicus]|uniref:Nucleolar 27S pre-rRNA processing Urb2/Npa2 C-terminal domain-containing protein n=1 Tax=Salinomyces thailandicus TaxID=706561 RepID=A0A4U0TVY9_9PEZI|nr:hypothetical protein B0A50_05361 [Salinomyces thailandica]
MPGLVAPTGSSLERLKALNSLPSLEGQLDEARRLCNHSARADMIAKWLLDNLKNSTHFQAASASWRLLSTASRLLTPERLSGLLGHWNLLNITREAISIGPKTLETLSAIKDLFLLLNELSEGPKGASLKALLSADAADSSTFTGTWLQCIANLAEDSRANITLVSSQRLLQPAIWIWNLRKPGAGENDLFAGHCLVPATRLVCLMSSTETEPTIKRKRDDAASKEQAGALESLLAKHFVLPARKAFFNSADDTKKTVDLHRRLATLKMASTEDSGSIKDDTKHSATVPAILDIALRCSPLGTPRQRTKERPWVEAIFAALADCVPSDALTQQGVLVAMLDVVKKFASLSKESLATLVKRHATSSEQGSQHDLHWTLVAKVVELDANVFAYRESAAPLFDAISQANVSSPQGNTRPADGFGEDVVGEQVFDIWRSGIIVPTLHAFSRGRDLATFVLLWHQQLQRGIDDKKRCVWLKIDDDFAQLLEGSMTDAQIIELVNRFHTDLKAALTSRAAPAEAVTTRKILASIVLLHAITFGVKKVQLLDQLHSQIGQVFDDTMAIFENPTIIDSASNFGHAWKLLRISFQTWFTLWAVQQSSEETVGNRLSSVIHSKAVSMAVQVASSEAVACAEARHLLAVLANVAHAHGLSVTDLVKTSWQVYLECPQATGALKNEGRTELTSKIFNAASGELAVDKSLCDCLAKVAEQSDGATENVVEAIVEKLQSKKSTRVATGLHALEALPISTLATAQHERLLDALSERAQPSKRIGDIQRDRFAAMIRLLGTSFPNTQICKDASVLWDFAVGLDDSQMEDESKANAAQLLQQLVSIVVKQLLRRRNRQEPLAILVDMTKKIDHHVKRSCSSKSKLSDNTALLALVKTVLSEMSTSLDEETMREYFKKDRLESYAQALLHEVETIQSSRSSERHLAVLLDALVSLPKSVTMVETAGGDSEIVAFVDRTLRSAMKSQHTSGSTMAAAKCVQIACRWSLPVDESVIVETSARAIESDLPSTEYISLLDALQQRYKDDPKGRIAALQSVLRSGRSVRAAELVVLRTVISSLKEEDFQQDACTFTSPQEALLRFLDTANETTSAAACRRSLDCTIAILKEKPFMTNQFAVETTLSAIQHLVTKRATSPIYLDACRLFTVLLQQYRSRLKDRLNLVVPVLQSFISCLFTHPHPTPLAYPPKPLTTRHASALARLIQLLCNPPQLRSRRHQPSTSLVDETRKAQAHVGQYAQFLLHHYCTEVLSGSLAEGVREALMPGLWALIEAVEVHDVEGVRVLSAAASNSERAVLRGVYEEYRAFGKWKGG